MQLHPESRVAALWRTLVMASLPSTSSGLLQLGQAIRAHVMCVPYRGQDVTLPETWPPLSWDNEL